MDRTTKPVGTALVRARVTADVLTAVGLVMSGVTALVVASGHLVWAVVMLFPTGLPDLFDGAVAKASGTASVRGAYFDSVADRLSDALILGGISWYLVSRHHGTVALLPFAVLGVTQLISYQRAKAELLGIAAAKGGLMERAERFILLGVCFVAGSVTASAFVPALWVYLGLVAATAAGRFVRVWQVAEGPVRPARPRRAHGRPTRRPITAWREAGGFRPLRETEAMARFRAWREAAPANRAARQRRRATSRSGLRSGRHAGSGGH
ncbi:MAG: CDP-alcohol phosphatidyltransferase family protein [Acidobacteriota bacterium]|nr:CDP-alcohol phosphatidyltransferase family protein [Acidobacteriota bacterium]